MLQVLKSSLMEHLRVVPVRYDGLERGRSVTLQFIKSETYSPQKLATVEFQYPN
jgi:hypothetical protein